MKSEIGILSGKVSETRYTSPELELLNVNAESGFATSNYGEPEAQVTICMGLNITFNSGWL